MRRRIFLTVMMVLAGFSCFGQTAALRDYVGKISQTFHPDIISYLENFRSNLDKRGYNAAAKGLGVYLKGDSGTGFVYVANNGRNFILTNYHVISQAQTLTVTFEKQDGEQSKFSGLTIVAADEDMDIALLAFAGGQNPFKQGLSFLSRPVQEGDDVYSAGFPGLGDAGGTMIWQLGRGMASNASVRLPLNDENGTMIGPFIQHTAQVDPGNSGGPLLVQMPGVPTGYAVAGINTLSAVYRQAANYSIPMNRVQSFLDASLAPAPADTRPQLDARLSSFIDGLSVPKAVYPHIAKYLSNDCAAENAEYALSEWIEKAPRTVIEDIATAFGHSPVRGMSYAVAWTIENALRNKSGKIAVAVDMVTPADSGGFTVAFKVNDKSISSEWISEYGIWRIKSFGDFAAGDKSLVKKKAEKRETDARLRTNPDFQVDAGYAYILDRGSAIGLNVVRRDSFTGFGMRGYLGIENESFLQADVFGGLYFPIALGQAALTPFLNVGGGFQLKDRRTPSTDPYSPLDNKAMDFLIPLQGGLMFTTAAVPGLFLQAAYQYNISLMGDKAEADPHILFFSIGYAF